MCEAADGLVGPQSCGGRLRCRHGHHPPSRRRVHRDPLPMLGFAAGPLFSRRRHRLRPAGRSRAGHTSSRRPPSRQRLTSAQLSLTVEPGNAWAQVLCLRCAFFRFLPVWAGDSERASERDTKATLQLVITRERHTARTAASRRTSGPTFCAQLATQRICPGVRQLNLADSIQRWKGVGCHDSGRAASYRGRD